MAIAVKRNACERWRWTVVLGLVWLGSAQGIRFDVEHQECLVHETEADGEFVQIFVEVVRAKIAGPFRHLGVDVVVQAPGGHYVHTEKVKHGAKSPNDKLWDYEAKINFTAAEKGRYNICFYNRGNEVETVILEMQHKDADYEEPVKDEHIQSLMKQIASLSDALVDVEFEQDWLASHTNGHATILSDMSKRVVYKAVLEAFAIVACSVLQVHLMQRLLQKNLLGKQL